MHIETLCETLSGPWRLSYPLASEPLVDLARKGHTGCSVVLKGAVGVVSIGGGHETQCKELKYNSTGTESFCQEYADIEPNPS
jgi:hypothetical protein